ncbi:MAG: hypothetical protein J6X70_02050 [Muribaculaceae bacterium]|nr:hypothetical protein [Muribaculaceae bacterium]
MKRLALISLAIIAFAQFARAEYEYGPAKTETLWYEDDQQFVCRLFRNDPPKLVFEVFGCFIKIGNHQVVDLQLAGKEGYSKELRFTIGALADGSIFDFCGSVGEGWVDMPILIQMKDGKKLNGVCRCSTDILKGDVVKRAFTLDPNYPQYHRLCRVYVGISFSDLHAKGEPDPDSLDHETFIGQAISSSNIKSLELGKGAFKTKFGSFSTQLTIQAMLRSIADCTYETELYFPANTSTLKQGKLKK